MPLLLSNDPLAPVDSFLVRPWTSESFLARECESVLCRPSAVILCLPAVTDLALMLSGGGDSARAVVAGEARVVGAGEGDKALNDDDAGGGLRTLSDSVAGERPRDASGGELSILSDPGGGLNTRSDGGGADC